MKVKRFIAALAALVFILVMASPALAVSLGISPSHSDLEVPGNGSAVANFKVHYYSGDLEISLVDIPLRVEPETVHIESSDEPTTIELTIYGDESLGSRIYDGYVRFLGVSGGSVAAAVEVKAKITNLVEGETPVLATPEESQPTPEEAIEETPLEEEVLEQTTTEESEQPSTPSESSSFPVLPVAGIAAGAIIITTLIIVIARRYQY